MFIARYLQPDFAELIFRIAARILVKSYIGPDDPVVHVSELIRFLMYERFQVTACPEAYRLMIILRT